MIVTAEREVPICIFTHVQCSAWSGYGNLWDFDENCTDDCNYVPIKNKTENGTRIITFGCENCKWKRLTMHKTVRNFEQIGVDVVKISGKMYWLAEFIYLEVTDGGYKRVIVDNREVIE